MATRNEEVLVLTVNEGFTESLFFNGRPNQWFNFEQIFTVNKIVVMVFV